MKRTGIKQVLALMLCAVVMMPLAAGFAGCGTAKTATTGGEKYIGTWTAVNAKYNDEEHDVSELLGSDFTFTLKSNGTAEIKLGETEEKIRWETVENGFKLVEGRNEYLMTANGEDSVVWDNQGVLVYLKKQQ